MENEVNKCCVSPHTRRGCLTGMETPSSGVTTEREGDVCKGEKEHAVAQQNRGLPSGELGEREVCEGKLGEREVSATGQEDADEDHEGNASTYAHKRRCAAHLLHASTPTSCYFMACTSPFHLSLALCCPFHCMCFII